MERVFQKQKIPRKKLKEIILKNPEALSPGLSFIDLELGTQENGFMDFLGIDDTGRLVVVNFDIESANEGILEGTLSQLQWLKDNETLIKRLFFNENIDFNRAAEIILVCDCFSKKIQSAAKQLELNDIKLIEVKYVVNQDIEGVIFEKIFDNKQQGQLSAVTLHKTIEIEQDETLSSPGEIPAEKKITKKFKPAIVSPVLQKRTSSENIQKKEALSLDDINLTPEEIAEFMDFNKTHKLEKIAD
ncbi:MAG: hypothetical protein ABIG64_05645 [Candidatus Omnitrophota bacterium]